MDLVDTPTVLALDIETENLFIQYDKSIKKVLANKPILARILKFTVHELSSLSIQQIEACIESDSIMIGQTFVEPGLTNPKIVSDQLEDDISGEGRIVYDLRFAVNFPDGEMTNIIINVEAQRKSNPGYSIVKRGIFYVARLLSAQLNTEFTNNGSNPSQYDDIKKVYSIWICMDCPENKKDSIVSYSLSPEILYQGSEKFCLDYAYDLMSVVVVHLSGGLECSQNQLIGMLDTLLGAMDVKAKKQRLQEDFQLPMTMKIDQEVSDMCNLSVGLWEEALNKGRLEGERMGRLEGERRGRLEGERYGERKGKLMILRDMILDGFTTIDKLRATGRYAPEELDYVANSLKS